jgi:hypothetical protein
VNVLEFLNACHQQLFYIFCACRMCAILDVDKQLGRVLLIYNSIRTFFRECLLGLKTFEIAFLLELRQI